MTLSQTLSFYCQCRASLQLHTFLYFSNYSIAKLHLSFLNSKLILPIDSMCLLNHALPPCLPPVSRSSWCHLVVSRSLFSALLSPCSLLLHSGLSFIMHVKQTDMSESLKCMAVPSLLLDPPAERSHVSEAPCVQPVPGLSCTFCRKKVDAIFVQESALQYLWYGSTGCVQR